MAACQLALLSVAEVWFWLHFHVWLRIRIYPTHEVWSTRTPVSTPVLQYSVPYLVFRADRIGRFNHIRG